MTISCQLKGEVAVATADLQDRLRRMGKYAFHELIGIERTQFNHGNTSPLEPFALIEFWASSGIARISDEGKVTHSSPPSPPRLESTLCSRSRCRFLRTLPLPHQRSPFRIPPYISGLRWHQHGHAEQLAVRAHRLRSVVRARCPSDRRERLIRVHYCECA